MRSLTFTDLHTMGFPHYAVVSTVVFSPGKIHVFTLKQNEMVIAFAYVCHNFHVYQICYAANKISMKLYFVAYQCRIPVQ